MNRIQPLVEQSSVIVRHEYRACAADTGDLTCEYLPWRATFAEAHADALDGSLDAEPPYDERWIEMRALSDPVRLTGERVQDL